ncbi:cysteine--tRNA ligase, partial [Patescibacteria group bacterium]|nr:cysteine--tRNA ligase [Patescibacteria group bacterium]
LAVIQKLLKSKLSDSSKLATILDFDKVLGLKIKESLAPAKIPEKVKKLAHRRELARQSRNWQQADKLRQQIKKLGYEIKDTKV